MFQIFKLFFFLGWVSFGGPAAHIGYFRQAFVEKRAWLTDSEYAQIVALSQFLPGPGSSQVGFAVGYHRGGLKGAIAAFLGFTLPSVIVMVILASASAQLMGQPLFEQVVHGLKLLAVVVVADATWGMFKNFCKQKTSVALAFATAIVLLIAPSLSSQMLVLVVAALIGMKSLAPHDENAQPQKVSVNVWPLALFGLLLLALPLAAATYPSINLFSQFYQAGSLVFGGGHVVLPLLQNSLGDAVSTETFLTGYAAAQAVPGPMFTMATFLGFHLLPTSPVIGALLATLAIFLPGFLLLLGVLSHWRQLAQRPKVSGAIAGVNAAVVGLLAAALYQPVVVSAVGNGLDMAAVLLGFYLLKQLKLSIVWLVALFIVMGPTLAFIG
jgi:chromate transporter